MSVLVLVAEPDFLAVRKEDEGHVDWIGIAPSVRLAAAQVYADAFGFEDRERTALPIE